MILRLLNWQGIAGIAASLTLGLLLIVQKIETGHWRKQSASFEQLYRQDQAAFAAAVANTRAAAAQAVEADQANLRRVTVAQTAITERTNNDFEARLAAARADAQRLRIDAQANSGAGRSPSMPGLPAAARSASKSPVQDGLSQPDALTATEQAIQLDELIKWVRRQATVDNNPKAVASPPSD
jgi:hypothetical protein